jgi:hypothetical protein
VLDLETIIRHGPIGESSEDILYFSLEGNDVHPGVTRVVINYDESLERCCIGWCGIMCRTKQIHMK